MAWKLFPFNFATASDELKRLISKYPDYPIVVLAGDEANPNGDYPWMYCSDINFDVCEFLDCEVPFSETVMTDRGDFEEKLEEWLWDEVTDYGANGIPEDAFQKELAEAICDFEPYWKKVIAIYANN